MIRKPENIDEYIAGFPGNVQEKLTQIRNIIKKAVPDAEEKISYAIPTFALNGRNLIHFAGFKNHIGLYPAPREDSAFSKELSKFKGGKGTVQFPLDQPLPVDLIVRIVKFRVNENQKK